MGRLTIGRLPYWTMAVLLAGLTLALIFLGFRLGLGLYSFSLLAIPVALMVWYMAEYSTTQVAALPATTAPPSPASTSEAFDDPVIEADLFDSVNEPDSGTPAVEKAPPSP